MNARPTDPPSPVCKLEQLSTRELKPEHRFEAWKNRGHQFVELEPLAGGAQFDAELIRLRHNTCTVGAMRSSAYASRTEPSKRGSTPEMAIISLMQAGEVRVETAGGATTRLVKAGSLGLFDLRCRAHYQWGAGSREIFLALPRSDAVQALGRDLGEQALSLEKCLLAPALIAQLSFLTREARRLDAAERATMMATVHAMALLVLRQMGLAPHQIDISGEGLPHLLAARHAAALHFMEAEAHRPDLNAELIAQGAGCSRTRLYDAFAAQGTTVMSALREMRLQRARHLIEQSTRLHLGALSWRCGFADQSSFSKLFKARFGMPPTAWHAQARSALVTHDDR